MCRCPIYILVLSYHSSNSSAADGCCCGQVLAFWHLHQDTVTTGDMVVVVEVVAVMLPRKAAGLVSRSKKAFPQVAVANSRSGTQAAFRKIPVFTWRLAGTEREGEITPTCLFSWREDLW